MTRDQNQDDELTQEFASLCDDELLARYASGSLTDEAMAVARAEAHRRGLKPVEPTPVVEEAEPYFGDFVIVARNLNLSEANIYKALLQAAAIPAEVGDANFSRAYVSLFSANVRVPAAFVAEAKEVFAAFKRGDFALDDGFEPDA